MTENQHRMIFMLCRGPNYSSTDTKEIVNILDNIKENVQEKQICLPNSFDICENSMKIWDYTYVRCKEGLIVPVNYSRTISQNGNICNGSSRTDQELSLQQSQFNCLNIEHDLKDDNIANLVCSKRDNCQFSDDLLLKWIWESSRIALSQEINYAKAFNLMNIGALRNGYHDIGKCWREELETHGLTKIVDLLWFKIKPFYQLLHGVLRNALMKKYNRERIISQNGPLPSYLLGPLSSSNWEKYLDLLLPSRKVNLHENFIKKNWTNLDMVKRSEDFYASLGLSRMTASFWNNSNFSNTKSQHKCSRDIFANIFDGNNYRLNLCVDQSLNDFYKIIHQMGYIEYNMEFSDQPGLFQNPTNSAFGEVIGDVIFLGIITPQHLNRLTLLPDKFLYPNKISNQIHDLKLSYDFDDKPQMLSKNNPGEFDDIFLHILQIDNYKTSHDKMNSPLNDFDISILLKMALNKIPKISFEYIMDKVRWDLFSGKINLTIVNEHFWQLVHQEQGIYSQKNHFNFIDHTTEFHITNNIPYVSYFLSSFLEVQIFKGLCEYTIFGEFSTDNKIPMPLHRCDIYGSKRAGRLLRKAMRLGSSVHWSEVLFILTGKTEISAIPLLEYYEPLIIWLENIVIKNNIELGW